MEPGDTLRLIYPVPTNDKDKRPLEIVGEFVRRDGGFNYLLKDATNINDPSIKYIGLIAGYNPVSVVKT